MLELNNLRRSFNGKVALDDMTIRVERGGVVGFLGPNGAGKTTAMRVALGITQPDSGTVVWDNAPVDLSVRNTFGSMPEERGLYPAMKIIDQLEFLGALHGMKSDVARERAMHWLAMLGIADNANSRLDALSLGNQQRVQLAATLTHDPVVLILDEPFSGLDPTGIDSLSNVLRERAAAGCAVVFSSHQLDLVESVCDRVEIVNKGRNVRSGTLRELTETNDRLRVNLKHCVDEAWWSEVAGVGLLSRDDEGVLLSISSPQHAEAIAHNVLQAALRNGELRHFSFERLRLSEVFKNAVDVAASNAPTLAEDQIGDDE